MQETIEQFAAVFRQQAHRFGVAEGQNKQPGAAIPATLPIAHHRAAAVIDLSFFAGSSEDDAR